MPLKGVKQVPKASCPTSNLATKSVYATSGKRLHMNVTKSREDLISYVSFHSFDMSNIEWQFLPTDNLGSGQFGEIKLAKIKTLDVMVAAKVPKVNVSRKLILAETVVLMTLSGHVNFPFCFGILLENVILMEYFGSCDAGSWKNCPNFSQKQHSHMTVNESKYICKGILNAVIYLHKKKILHNDIKADNVVIANEVKMIDFGKATMLSSPLIYNIVPGSNECNMYNTRHRHIAYELRNIPGTKQSVKTDIYSVGYMFKHAAARISYDPIIELGRLMKRDIESRISAENALEKLLRF